jgi:hypothetical protein
VPVTVTDAPAVEKAEAIARPMPLVPPVTSTDVPEKSKLSWFVTIPHPS